jgi:hypothetical protein
VQGKNSAGFLRKVIHNEIHNRDSGSLWKSVAGPRQARPFSLIRNDWHRLPAAGYGPLASRPAECLRPARLLGYPSRVCSIKGDAVDRIAKAIDQLASDARAESSGPEMASRVAELWLMVSALDPELARRSQHYTTTADGTPCG